MRRTAVRLVALALAAGGVSVGAGAPALADTAATPGDITGYAFDTCRAPSQAQMDAWRTHSPYWGVGIYIAGMNRACKEQANLDSAWVSTQDRKGWRLLPLSVGRQAACAPGNRYGDKRISDDPAQAYAEARSQGVAEAREAVQAARELGIGAGSVLWYDLEHFDLSASVACRESALTFLSAWTSTLRKQDYLSGLYSSASSGITLVDDARRNRPGSFALPDYLWFAEWNGHDDLESRFISEEGWWPHRRVHQYRGDHDETHDGVTLRIDSNYMSTGRGTRAGRQAPSCGVTVNYPGYPRLSRGDRAAELPAAQCLLRKEGFYSGDLGERFDGATERAVERFQASRPGVPRTGVLNARTWTALLSSGPTPVTKAGSGGDAVRRVQRALNAASDVGLAVDGVFDEAEMRAVTAYQRQAGLEETGVVADETWAALQRGVPVGHLRTVTDAELERLLAGVEALREVVPFSSGVAQP